MEEQECKKCGNFFPKTNEYFNWENKTKGILKKNCKPCHHAVSKIYRQNFKYKKQQKENELPDMIEVSPEEKQRLMFNAFRTIYAHAFDKLLTKTEYEKLKIVR